MGSFLPFQRPLIVKGVNIAEGIVSKGTKDNIYALYDVKTLEEFEGLERENGVFAKLLYVEAEEISKLKYYRICLQDDEILRFLQENHDIDFLTFLVFIFTHELIHIQRFATGRAEFFGKQNDEEELYVDNMTRILLAKYPVCGMSSILVALDRISPPPLYKNRILLDNGGNINAYL